jgi:hypothetical protein
VQLPAAREGREVCPCFLSADRVHGQPIKSRDFWFLSALKIIGFLPMIPDCHGVKFDTVLLVPYLAASKE